MHEPWLLVVVFVAYLDGICQDLGAQAAAKQATQAILLDDHLWAHGMVSRGGTSRADHLLLHGARAEGAQTERLSQLQGNTQTSRGWLQRWCLWLQHTKHRAFHTMCCWYPHPLPRTHLDDLGVVHGHCDSLLGRLDHADAVAAGVRHQGGAAAIGGGGAGGRNWGAGAEMFYLWGAGRGAVDCGLQASEQKERRGEDKVEDAVAAGIRHQGGAAAIAG